MKTSFDMVQSIRNSLIHAWEIHTNIVCKGVGDEHFVGNSLVDLYAKCGSMFELYHIMFSLQYVVILLFHELP